ncbi:MAG: hypothetical protein A2283_22315 [Lentisphaerae bacterium RIFOXYA12_FULL_48_11]|nr:MAG: hypothetical protein A2283_22315 [Lentisphaerae bacterium RIFOXYA12_FULL_48_11]
MENTYSEEFYSTRDSHTRQSAEKIVPLIMDVFRPRNVVDIGCGVGTWLKVFKEYGCRDVLGIDQKEVPREFLQMDVNEFMTHDFEKPLSMDRSFDLVMSLEVAEHLSPEYADRFVESLTRLGPVVIFSAAIPRQGGVCHQNEQWQDYWKEMFAQHGFVGLDLIRPRIWNESCVAYWYRQNILVYLSSEKYEEVSARKDLWPEARSEMISVVHPLAYSAKCMEIEGLSHPPAIRQTVRLLVRLIVEKFLRFVRVSRQS